jgi:hypothetical protein
VGDQQEVVMCPLMVCIIDDSQQFLKLPTSLTHFWAICGRIFVIIGALESDDAALSDCTGLNM